MESHTLCSWNGKLNILNLILKLIYSFCAIPMKIPFGFVLQIWQADPKIHMEGKGPWKGKTILQERNKGREFTLSNFKIYYIAVVIKTVSYGHKNRHVDQWNMTDNPQTNIPTYSQLIFSKDARTIQWGQNVFSTKVVGYLKIPLQKKKN